MSELKGAVRYAHWSAGTAVAWMVSALGVETRAESWTRLPTAHKILRRVREGRRSMTERARYW